MTRKWDSRRPTPKWPKSDSKDSGPYFEFLLSHFWVTWCHSGAETPGVTFESLLSGAEKVLKELLRQRFRRTFGWTFWCDLPQNPCFTGYWLVTLRIVLKYSVALFVPFWFLILGCFNSLCVSVELGGRPLHNLENGSCSCIKSSKRPIWESDLRKLHQIGNYLLKKLKLWL